MMSNHNFMLFLKALIWSIYVSYGKETVARIINAVEENCVPEDHPDFDSSHLGRCLKTILNSLPDDASRNHLAESLRQVQSSDASMVYQNMVFEIGHYVCIKETVNTVPENCHGVVYHISKGKISVLFRQADHSFVPETVYPDQILPVYTLTIPDPSA
jgi:hypothetical protein